MKNIHVLPTDKKPIKGDLLLRHLWKGEPNECISWWRYNDTTMYGDTLVYTTLNGSFMDVPSSFKVQNIYITSDEEIKEGDLCLFGFNLETLYEGGIDWEITEGDIMKCIGYSDTGSLLHKKGSAEKTCCKKIILTTDQDLIKDGVQAIDDDFLEWFFINPSCESVVVEPIPNNSWGFDLEEPMTLGYKIIIPKEETKQDQVERMYSEEDVRKAIQLARLCTLDNETGDFVDLSGLTEICTYGLEETHSENSIIEQFKKK
jgi:hypothetical protein